MCGRQRYRGNSHQTFFVSNCWQGDGCIDIKLRLMITVVQSGTRTSSLHACHVNIRSILQGAWSPFREGVAYDGRPLQTRCLPSRESEVRRRARPPATKPWRSCRRPWRRSPNTGVGPKGITSCCCVSEDPAHPLSIPLVHDPPKGPSLALALGAVHRSRVWRRLPHHVWTLLCGLLPARQ